MDSQKQRRPIQRKRIRSNDGNRASSGERQICLPLTKQQYDDIWDDSAKVRIWIDQMVERSPELFPQQISWVALLNWPIASCATGILPVLPFSILN